MIRSFLFLLATTLAALAQPANLNDLSVANALGGKDVLETIRHAEAVTAQRVDTIPGEKAGEPSKFVVLGEPFPVPAEQATALKQAFTTGATYLSPSKSCVFRANVRYAFTAKQDTIRLVLCFGCGELEVWRGEKLVSFGPFDGGYGRILKITQQLFPQDEFLRKFNEQTFRERAARMQVDAPAKN